MDYTQEGIQIINLAAEVLKLLEENPPYDITFYNGSESPPEIEFYYYNSKNLLLITINPVQSYWLLYEVKNSIPSVQKGYSLDEKLVNIVEEYFNEKKSRL